MTKLPVIPADSDVRISRLIAEGTRQLDAARVHRRRIAVAVVAAGVVAGATSGVSLVVLANHHTQARSAYCYAGESTSSAWTQVGMADVVDGPGGPRRSLPDSADRVASALDLCGSVWRAGILTTHGPLAQTVPPLVPCERVDGVISVFAVETSTSAADICAANGQALATDRR